jgi:flagella basal body P-ring formation protein FlgA
LGIGLLLGLCLPPAWSQDDATATAALASTRQWLDTALRERPQREAGALRMEVVVGQLDSRLRLAACNRIEPYLPVNSRLWGRSQVGLRCLEGAAKWNVFLPVTVKAWGPAWVLKSHLAPGITLRESDAMQAEVDWAADNSPVLAEPAQWVGQTTQYPLAAGQTLRQSMVRAAQAFPAGATVRIVAQGPGFQISSQGQAQSAGVVGQSARVKTDSGNVVVGTVLDSYTVVMRL